MTMLQNLFIGHTLTLCAALAAATLTTAAAASDGPAWPALEANINSKIEAAMQAGKIPGMTVAVTKNGRLVLSKGYGLALADQKAVSMKADMRTRIGSVSKVVLTGPIAFDVMKQKGIDPKTKRLYGSGGVFGNKYESDQTVGVKRFSPILAMAIAPDDKIYTWYTNGKVSVGSSNDLDRYQEPLPFKLPAGRKLTDIRAVGITGSNSNVYAWYNDGGLSIGGSRDLGFRGTPKDKVKFPPGKSMLNVVGIAIAKSNDHVYVWYDDGTLSSGTSRDFTHYFTGRPYSVAHGSGQTHYNIRDIGIASNDHIYVWFSNGKASSGTSGNLAQYIQPYGYSLPPQGPVGGLDDRKLWYGEVTLQHLLRHRAGFQRSGDTEGAKKMFNVSENALTYEQVHRHFLRTQPLRWRPGEAYSYSNHGFGIWTLIIEALAGKSYRNYAIDNYLTPMGLQDEVRPQTVNNDDKDAFPYNWSNGKYQRLDFKHSTLGLAAGGWTASATSLVKFTDKLDAAYSIQEMKDMGWAQETRGKLHHNGRTEGGTAYVVMFPSGYKSVGGDDLGDVHVALATNIWTDAKALENLAGQIALAVPKSSISSSYDIWKGKPAH